MVAGMRKEEEDANEEEAQGEEGGIFIHTSVDDNSLSKVEEGKKQEGGVVDANADDNSLSSAVFDAYLLLKRDLSAGQKRNIYQGYK